MRTVSMVFRAVEVAVTVWVYAVVVAVVGVALLLVAQRVVPERFVENPGALRRLAAVVTAPLLMVVLAPLLILIGIALGARAMERWGRQRPHRRRGTATSRPPHTASIAPPPRRDVNVSDHADHLRRSLLAADVVEVPQPWRAHGVHPVGGLHGVGFGVDAATGHDLLMVVSLEGRGLLDTETGERVARDDGDEDLDRPSGPDLTCPGLGPLTGVDVRIAGLLGGGLHRVASSWAVEVTAPDWPDHRVVLTHGPTSWIQSGRWWLIAHTTSELRAAGFSPSGRTLVVATASELWWAVRAAAA